LRIGGREQPATFLTGQEEFKGNVRSFMNISNLLHPEILLDTRGPKNLRDFCKWSLQATAVLGESKYYFDSGKLPEHAQSILEPYITSAWRADYVRQYGLFKKFVENRGKTYYIPRDFLTALSKIDREIRVDYYPENFSGYFAFPKNFVKSPDGEFFNGAYVFSRSTQIDSNKMKSNYLNFMFVTLREGGIPPKFLNIGLELSDKASFSSYLATEQSAGMRRTIGTTVETFAVENSSVSLCSTIANALLYVHNESEELVFLRAASNPDRRNGKSIETAMGKAVNNCSIPVNLLSFNFHKRYHFDVASTEVRGHFRWQPYGPGLSKVKLIWIDAHVRHFNVEECPVSAG
jgi:hypothetical protein